MAINSKINILRRLKNIIITFKYAHQTKMRAIHYCFDKRIFLNFFTEALKFTSKILDGNSSNIIISWYESALLSTSQLMLGCRNLICLVL